MPLLETYLSGVKAILKNPLEALNMATRRPDLAIVAPLVVAALIAAVPLLDISLEKWLSGQKVALGDKLARETLAIQDQLAKEMAEDEKDLLKDTPATVTRQSGIFGLGRNRVETNPVFERKRAEARRIAEKKRADAIRSIERKKTEYSRTVGEKEARVRRAVAFSWWGAGVLSLGFLAVFLPLAVAAPAEGGRRRGRKGGRPGGASETVDFSSPITESAVGPEGRYLLREVIGRGTTGVVYRAWDKSLEREVAVKEMPKPLTADTEAYKRFRREALTLARLSHPGIVQVYDLFEKEGRAFLVMEYMGGGTLAQLVENEGRLDLHRAGGMGVTVFDALTYLHGQGVIHRDLKPGNILLNERIQPKLSDFGLARWDRQNDLTRDGAMLGSPNYMSPEQVAGKKADRRSDLYAFGAFLYWLVTGTPPFQGEVEAVLAMHLTRLPSPPSSRNPKVPRQLDSLVMSLLAKDPGDREQDIDKIRKALTALAGWK